MQKIKASAVYSLDQQRLESIALKRLVERHVPTFSQMLSRLKAHLSGHTVS